MTEGSAERNEKDGVLIDWTGNGPLTIENMIRRRDGRSGGACAS
jgi:hypothetical protein